jgi:tripartite-type tricarboxylate transporter receptor subunit TctC
VGRDKEQHMRKLARRQLLYLAAGALPSLRLSPARADAYPARPIRIICGFPAGGTADIAARLMGHWLSERLGQQFIVDNRIGASTNIATEAVAHAAADGCTLLAATATNTINPSLFDDLSFDFIRDIAMVGGIARNPLVLLVHPSVPATTLAEFVAYAKANPGKVTLASSGIGTIPHVTGELFKMKTGTNMLDVPYRGSVPMLTDLLAGRVQAAFDPLVTTEHIKSGELRALGVTTDKRWPLLPDLPAISESLPGFEASGWTAIAAPKATDPAIVQKLNSEINAGLADPGVGTGLAAFGGSPFFGSPADLDKLAAGDTAKWRAVIKFANIKPT